MPTKTQKTKAIQTRLSEDLVNQATEILDYIGISTTSVVRILFKNTVNNGDLPFEMTKPNKKNPNSQKTMPILS